MSNPLIKKKVYEFMETYMEFNRNLSEAEMGLESAYRLISEAGAILEDFKNFQNSKDMELTISELKYEVSKATSKLKTMRKNCFVELDPSKL